MQAVFQRFSGSLQKILEDIDRCQGAAGGGLEGLAGLFIGRQPIVSLTCTVSHVGRPLGIHYPFEYLSISAHTCSVLPQRPEMYAGCASCLRKPCCSPSPSSFHPISLRAVFLPIASLNF